ncbi:MFS transporter [Serinibacter arcticus]|uniref:Major facilitator superfamily MFS_1 n=1 Tax=Serinibacter arcticus TaxID=1655435 RepID=A0A4Z1E0B5_9MICO|nr:MFS transporter [Serinibacter arcticus]TGO05316.1 major facilitator superfamily MFS_1 [Serinibacter arcticus]
MPRILVDTRPLRESPAYRRMFWGLGVSQIGTQVTVVAVGLEVYHLTSSTFAVGLLGISALVPLVVLGLYGGALADAYDRRTVSLIAAGVMVTATAGLVVQAALGLASPGVLYGLVALQSAGSAVYVPARMAIIPRLVGKELLPAANALGALTGSVGLMVGPLLGALLAAQVGYALTYALDLVLFLFAFYALLRLPHLPPEVAAVEADADVPDPADSSAGALTPVAAAPQRRRVGFAAVAEGLGYLRTRRNVRMTFLLDIVAMVLSMPRVLFPAVGAVILGGGETTTGLLTAAIAVGSVLASAFSGGLGRVRRQGVAIVVAICAFGACTLGFGTTLLVAGRTEPDSVLVPLLVIGGLFLIGSGISDAISSVFRQTVLQSATPDHLRGRLQGVFIVVVAGGPRLGDLVLGSAATWWGEAFAAVGGGVLCIAVVLLLAGRNRSFLRYDARHPVA